MAVVWSVIVGKKGKYGAEEEHLGSQMGVWAVTVGQDGVRIRGFRDTSFPRALFLEWHRKGTEERLLRNRGKTDRVNGLPRLGLLHCLMIVLLDVAAEPADG